MENQKNSVQAEIGELQELCKRMEDMEMNESRFNPPTTEEEMLDWEHTNGITIPESYKEWLRFSNGSEIGGFAARLLGIKQMVVNYKPISEDLVIIGQWGGGGDSICFSKNTEKFVILHDSREEEFDSFKDIILKLIRIIKSILGEDETSREVTAKMIAMLEAKRDSQGWLPEKQAKILAMFESKKKREE